MKTITILPLNCGRPVKATSIADERSVAVAKFFSIIRQIFSTIFSARVSSVVACLCLAAMYWHNLSIADNVSAQQAVGFDCICGLPWAFVWAYRFTMDELRSIKKGGEA